MNLTITNDKPLDHRNLAETKYIDTFRRLTREKNCIVIESGTTMRAVASAMRHWINMHHQNDGCKVRSVQKYHTTASLACGWCIQLSRQSRPRFVVRFLGASEIISASYNGLNSLEPASAGFVFVKKEPGTQAG